MPKHLTACIGPTIASLRGRIRRCTRPSTRPILGCILDRFRSPEDLGRENALLRKQLEVACRQIARPRFTRADRLMLVLLAASASCAACAPSASTTVLIRGEDHLGSVLRRYCAYFNYAGAVPAASLSAPAATP